MILRVYFKEILLVLAYAVVQSLIFHFPQLWPLGFISLTPLFFLLYLCPSAKDAVIFGGLAGFLQTAGTFYWLFHATAAGYVVGCFYLGAYTALFSLLAYHSIQALGRAGTEGFGWGCVKILTVAALWVLVEFARSNVPVLRLPWALLGLSQWKNLAFIQSADAWGTYGISFLLAFFAAGVFGVWMLVLRFSRGEMSLRRYSIQLIVMAGLPLALAALNFSYGIRAMDEITSAVTPATPRSRIAVIQGNIPQDHKWDPQIRDMIFRKHDNLSRHVIMDAPDMVVWPETSFPGYWEVEPEMSRRTLMLARELSSELLVGTPSYRESEFGVEKMNSVIQISKTGHEIKRYSKIRLVPFGEYVPFFKFIRRFVDIGDFREGTEYTLFRTPVRWAFGVTPDNRPRAFSSLICFEDIFADLCRTFVRKGSSMFINVTNDGWFGNSTAPYQHAQSSVFRAVENRVPVVRAANTGLSCYIDVTGRVVDSVKDGGREIEVAGFKIFDVTLNHRPTLYTAYGDWFVVFLLTAFVLTHRVSTARLNTTPVDDLD